MKLVNDCTTVELEGELILVPLGKVREKVHGIIRFNDTAAFIVCCLKEETTFTKIIDKVLTEYAVERSEAEKHVNDLVEKLRATGLIEE